MSYNKTISTDNALEDYFLDLLINKHIIDREIQDLLDIINRSDIHPDYQIRLKRLLFGNKNMYIENWWTLGISLQDTIRSVDVRSQDTTDYGLVLQIMMRIIEEVFDVDDAHFHDFIHAQEKEDVEHQLIILIKRVLDFIELWIHELIDHTTTLREPIWDYLKDDFIVIQAALKKYPTLILASQKDTIHKLQISVNTLANRIHARKTGRIDGKL
jgi:hypothetical protein